MRKLAYIFLTAKRWLQLILLVSVLLVSWLLVSVLRWVKGDDWYQKQKSVLLPSPLGVTPAHADAPQQGGSTPFLAVWNGENYEIENDFLFGKPKNYFANFVQGKKSYEADLITPDLYKIQSPIEPKNGKLAFQIQEIEPEESFINGLSLLRVIHAKNSEVIVDSDYRKFYVVSKKSFEQSLISPASAKSQKGRELTHFSEKSSFWQAPINETFLDKQDYVDFTFRNLKPRTKYFLAHNSRYRVWFMGEGPSLMSQAQTIASLLTKRPVLAKAAFAGLLSLSFLGMAKGISWLPNVLFVLSESCGTGDSSGGSNIGGCCLPVFYKSSENKLLYAGTIETRAWRSNSELLELPSEAVLDNGEMHLRVLATQRHYLGFVGLVGEPLEDLPSQVETIKLARAYHHRLKKEVTNLLSYQRSSYLQTIPGDAVDLEFKRPKIELAPDEKETYLLGSAGFYTYLTQYSKMLAGDWERKLSSEAKERLDLARKDGGYQ